MRLFFKDKAITGIYVMVPKKELHFDEEVDNYDFPPETTLKLKKVMGYDTHRIFEGNETVSDIAVKGINNLIAQGRLAKEDIDALVLVTETPDQLIPPTSNIIQGRLGLKEDIICMDINQGCAGFELGLFEAFMLLEQPSIKKVVLVNGEILSRKVSKKDRNSYPLIGDAVAITIIEKQEGAGDIFGNIKMDGAGCYAIQIPAGGLRLPSSEDTRKEIRDDFGNWRSQDNLVMKGDEVFMFVMKKVPGLIRDVLDYSGNTAEDIKWYMFHQPNKMMVTKLADKLKVPRELIPANIVGKFGNSSSVTVPLNIAYNIGSAICSERMKLCMAGFGVGLVWASIVMNVGPLDFCEIEEVE